MKKTRVVILFVLVVSLFSTTPYQAVGNNVPSKTPPMSEVNMQAMVLRLQEIKEMDMSAMDRTEKRALRSEVREINKEIKRDGGGIYLSVGALLVVIILLILLL